MIETPPEPMIQMSVKELIGRVDAKVDTIILGLQGKANQSDVDALEARLFEIEKAQVVASAQTVRRSFWTALLLPVLVAAIAIATSLIRV